MNLCEMRSVGQKKDGRTLYRCARCGQEYRSAKAPGAIHLQCRTRPGPESQTPAARSATCYCYRAIYTAWDAAGKPERTWTEVARLLPICQKCPRWGVGRVANVLKMATFGCPQGRF